MRNNALAHLLEFTLDTLLDNQFFPCSLTFSCTGANRILQRQLGDGELGFEKSWHGWSEKVGLDQAVAGVFLRFVGDGFFAEFSGDFQSLRMPLR
jgi:hypothetical protein